MSSERSERVVHPSFVTPMTAATDKENEYHSAYNMASSPMTPGNKPQKKGKAMTTGRAKSKTTTSLLHEKPVRVPLSSKKMNGANSHIHHHTVNPFAGCDVSIHDNDHRSVRAVAGSAAKAKDGDNDHISLLYHVGGPISSHHAARVQTPHGKAMARDCRTPLIPKRMGVDGTYKTPSKELLRSTACSRGHEHHLTHHPHYQPFPGEKQTAMTTGGKTKKAREIAHSRCRDQSHHDREDIALRVPHVTFRGDVVADTTFDADLGTDDDDISALSIHLDCHVPESHGDAHSINVPDYIDSVASRSKWGSENIGSLVGEMELCHLGNETDDDEDVVRDGARNPIATTLHAEHFVMQHSKTASRPLLVPDMQLPHFTKVRSSPGGKIPGEVVMRPSVRHWGR